MVLEICLVCLPPTSLQFCTQNLVWFGGLYSTFIFILSSSAFCFTDPFCYPTAVLLQFLSWTWTALISLQQPSPILWLFSAISTEKGLWTSSWPHSWYYKKSIVLYVINLRPPKSHHGLAKSQLFPIFCFPSFSPVFRHNHKALLFFHAAAWKFLATYSIQPV